MEKTKVIREFIELAYGDYIGLNKNKKELLTLLKEQEEAVNYAPCSLQLKDKEKMTFDEWIKENNYRKVHKGYARNQIHFGDEEMLQRYNYYKRLL